MRSARVFLYLLLFAALNCSAQGATSCTGPVATPNTQLNSQVCDPLTGQLEKVTQVIQDANGQNAFVATNQQNVFLTLTTLGASFQPIVPPNQPAAPTYTITAVTTDSSTGLVTSVTLLSSAPGAQPTPWSVVNSTTNFNPNPGSGTSGGTVPPTQVIGSGPINLVARGANGGSGSDAYCITIPLIGCIGVPGSGGGNGQAPVPNPYSLLVPSSYPAINAVGVPGIVAGSVGGNGGNGGDKYGLGGSGYDGGNAANGGDLILNNQTSVTTSGDNAYGIFEFSHAGQGGKAGSGYGAVGGGSGGTAAAGGNVSLTNSGDIDTNGVGAFGLYALSTGGSAGSGGDSWGIVGTAGSSSKGGDGGQVSVTNSGNVTTHGDRSYGILAQSIGGTGGNGGDSGGLFSESGQGSPGGNGNTVTVTNSGQVKTYGSNSIGILAQSIGGNGGAGGSSSGLAALGGNGSGGGDAGAVTVLNNTGGRIATTGASAAGIEAQSIGGGGGAVGSTAGAVAIGGSAAQGGNGAAVSVVNAGQITTGGDDSRGILAQSIGGGGGSVASAGGLVSLGGSSGAGGNGGTVSVSNDGVISTSGARSDVIVAQSVGGGGGSVGSGFGAVTLGGSAANGGKGGGVTVSNGGQITSSGDDSRGILAQSIGGGGGLAGSSRGVFALGGSGGSGNDAAAVTVTNGAGASISTTGARSDGILAQSIGGGGGAGGSAGGLGAIGGSGSVGGAGGNVTVTQIGTITTHGSDSLGIFAQSVGGGGGDGGSAQSGGLELGVAVGGRGQSGGDGGQSSVLVGSSDGNSPVQPNSVTTSGDRSIGILVQSVGGGGGNGGSAVQGTAGTGISLSVALGGSGAAGGKGGQVSLNGAGTVNTGGQNAAGIVLQSVGGGGGNGGTTVSSSLELGDGASVSVAVGGSGGRGGNGGTVNANLLSGSSVTTQGDQSSGIVLQSVGGGGGNGGLTVAAAGALGVNGSGAVSVAVGGGGGNGGDAGAVDATVNSQISTAGDNASGLVVQAIGGGGGNSGLTVAAGVAISGIGSSGVSVGVGGSGGSAGQGGQVTADYSGALSTGGNHSTGILVQSVGGGGGNSGGTISASMSGAGAGAGGVSVGVGGDGGGGGVGGTVRFTTDAGSSITTTGGSSTGILVQSIGGGGGNGGYDITASAAGAGTGSGAVSVGVGGNAGVGGDAGTVNATLNADVTTAGQNSGAIAVQSVGGGGGNAGLNVAVSGAGAGTGSGSASVGIGGSGGNGGQGSDVTATVNGNLTTGYGSAAGADNSAGLLVQSIGGGGGNAGIDVTGAIAVGGTGSGSVGVGTGGSGGGGGAAGQVKSQLTGNVNTNGNNSGGVIVQSLGGGGGNGGMNVTGSVGIASTGTGSVAIGIGGSGGGGGAASQLSSQVTGDVSTNGNNSIGVLAQSLGGGGGNGAMNVSGSITASQKASGNVAVGVGGFGGGGGNADTVSSTATGDVSTVGSHSGAIVAQSLGGGGGNGGLNVSGSVNLSNVGGSIGVGVGGFGGGAGNGAAVAVNANGNLSTVGDDSDGILAQSIGGGGGNGGLNIAGALNITKPGGSIGGAISVGVGGFGGSGGSSSDVTVQFDGNISTRQTADAPNGSSSGIAAQSIGGGGGNGGMNVSGGMSIAASKADGYGLTVGVGGFGGAGGDAGDVSVTVTGNKSISGWGADGSGILAQSIGGAGGNGGLNVTGGVVSDSQILVGVGGSGGNAGLGKDVAVTADADIYASASNATMPGSAGILAQSIGGGGGNGGMDVTGGLAISKPGNVPSITLGIGGQGGAAATSGNVSVTETGDVRASGAWVSGIVAQSIAGGGGNGGLNVAGSINWSDSTNSGGKTDLSIDAGVGGFGGKGANAGNVTVNDSGIVYTNGDNAKGVLAQSVGGGGGNGGLNVTGIFAKNSQPISVDIGGSGNTGGDAGSATIQRGTADAHAGWVFTTGSNANAIEASSVGGGGGDAGMTFNAGISLAGADTSSSGYSAQILVGGSGADAGNGGAAIVANYSSVLTLGDNSNGVVAQSVGGGGGNAGISLTATYQNKNSKNMAMNVVVGGGAGNGGGGGTADVTNVGDVDTYGNSSYGILAQSIGGGGGNAELSMAYTKSDGNQLGINIGRQGGIGGAGGDVSLSSDGTVTTRGNDAFGLFAQSVGNGGGNSTATSVSLYPETSAGAKASEPIRVSVGLEGGEGGSGGDVTLNAAGQVSTSGSDATAIFAQSVGGGGGNGGGALTAAPTASVMGVAVGGTGGKGGFGGDIAVTSSAQVSTSGNDSAGIVAQSVGGGGGNGGYAMTGGYKVDKVSLNAVVGGNGGEGMSGGTVDVTNSGGIFTQGTGSYGVLAQSIGGGGGKAGTVVDFTSVPGDTTANALALAIGGNGGSGGIGGGVTLNNTGWVETNGVNAIGLFAQSIGGGGGDASNVLTVLSGGATGSNSFSVGVGGAGGTGGSAGDVRVENNATVAPNSGMIVTNGDNADGIYALSVGGGGGKGSSVVSVTSTKGASGEMSAESAAVSIGGSGGSGGTGGNVTVINSGSISTFGTESHGILAESVGGGGGQGGLAISGDLVRPTDPNAPGKNLTLAVGGFGGAGNTAGSVSVTNSGTIEVFGNKSDGIFAQSVGGGGGNGGLAVALSNNLLTKPTSNPLPWLTNVGLGGFGGSGGDGGAVTVNNTGTIISHGDDSYGIFAQSVGGGGGKAGLSISSPAWTAASYELDTRLGGGSNGADGAVQVNQNGSIIMLGQNSQAQLAQSVNGGGGDLNLYLDFSQQAAQVSQDGASLTADVNDPFENAKANVSQQIALGAQNGAQATGADVAVTNVGDFMTGGAKSIASLVQSIGGGGGNANSTMVVDNQGDVNTQAALGATQTDASNGGNITINRTGSVTTFGNDSVGNSVQSIGGGGGMLLAEVDRVSSTLPQPKGSAPGSATASVALGADQTTASNGGDVNLQTAGNLITVGARSTGLLLQSIGAGGGAVNLAGYDSAQVTLGGTNGGSGNGGTINLTNIGSIVTTGKMANGVVLQSIGGGGGAVFSDINASRMSVKTSSANSGNGGNIAFIQNGDVAVSGDNAIAIVAQSLGGGGGIVDRTFMDSAGGSGTSGSVNLVLNGNVIASGTNGIGVFAQSRAANGQGDISIELAANKFIYAGTNGIGVQLFGGNHNQFTNNGSISGADGLKAWTIVGDNGNDRVDNYGLIIGQINLGAGKNQFVNRNGALFIPGPQILLGDPSSIFQNDGTIIIGGGEKTQHTDVTGSFVQSASGSTYAKLDFSADAIDQLSMTGTASLAGNLNLSLLNPQLVPYGHFRKTVFSAAEGVTNNGMVLNTAPSAVITYGLVYPNSTTAAVDYSVQFAPTGLSHNLTAVGRYFDRIQAAGSSVALADTVTKLVYDPNLAVYRQSLLQLTPDFYGELQSGLIVSNQRFAQILIDGGSVQYVGKRGMLWLNDGYENLQHSGYGDYKAVRQIGRRGGLGFQKRLDSHWTAGLGFTWQANSADGNSGLWTGTGNTEQFGGMLSREFGRTVVSGTLSYAWNSMSSDRTGDLTSPFTGHLRRGLGTFGATARVSHSLARGGWYLKPIVDLGLTDLLAHSATESGVGATALVLGNYSEAHVWVRPAGEVGHVFKFTDTTALRPFINLGNRSYLNDSHTYARATFFGAPSTVSPMAVPIDLGSLFEGTAGFEFTAGDHLSLGVQYGKTCANHYNMNSANFFLRVK